MLATADPANLISLLSQAPPMVVLVVIVVMFLRHIQASAAAMQARDDNFIAAMQQITRDVEAITQQSDAISTRIVAVMGEATEALRRTDADLNAIKASR